MKRLGFLIAIVSVLAVAAPAYAQTAPTAGFSAPNDGAVLEGTTTIRATGSSTAGIRNIKLFIEGTQVASKDFNELRQNVELDYVWNTAAAVAGSGISRNGWYQLKVVATANGGAEDSRVRNVRIDNPAAPPTGLRVVPGEGKVNLYWDANQEPDILGYRVEVYQDGGWAKVDQTTSSNYVYEIKAGTYMWRIVALRSSTVTAEGRPSNPSPSVSGTVTAPPSAQKGKDGSRKVVGSKKVFGGATNKEAREALRETARRFASGGISSAAISLPGVAIGLPSLPDNELEWGTYEEALPYNVPSGKQVPASFPIRYAAQNSSIVPPDGLRWVAAGLLLVVISGLLMFFSQQLGKRVEAA